MTILAPTLVVGHNSKAAGIWATTTLRARRNFGGCAETLQLCRFVLLLRWNCCRRRYDLLTKTNVFGGGEQLLRILSAISTFARSLTHSYAYAHTPHRCSRCRRCGHSSLTRPQLTLMHPGTTEQTNHKRTKRTNEYQLCKCLSRSVLWRLCASVCMSLS